MQSLQETPAIGSTGGLEPVAFVRPIVDAISFWTLLYYTRCDEVHGGLKQPECDRAAAARSSSFDIKCKRRGRYPPRLTHLQGVKEGPEGAVPNATKGEMWMREKDNVRVPRTRQS